MVSYTEGLEKCSRHKVVKVVVVKVVEGAHSHDHDDDRLHRSVLLGKLTFAAKG